MELRGNRGEWSELYAFLKLLADGEMHSGDGHLEHREGSIRYPILEVFRDDSPDRASYRVSADDKSIYIEYHDASAIVTQEKFRDEAMLLMKNIREMSSTADFPDIHPFLKKIGVDKIKAKSRDKADIRIVIHNLHNGTRPELGYSIKSRLGAPSTLINACNDNTNFIYQVVPSGRLDVGRFNVITRFRQKFECLKDSGSELRFKSAAGETMHHNLTMLDMGMETIIAHELRCYYEGRGRTVSEITSILTEEDPLGISNGSQPMYEYKVKQFLLAFALGMTPAKPWKGRFNANGGYIVVKEDGDIVCYHFFDRNDLEDYLYYNTYFDTPSTSRHQFGTIYTEHGDCLLKLNLQIRFL